MPPILDGKPCNGFFYELYRDEDAFHAHRGRPAHAQVPGRRDQYLGQHRGGLADAPTGKGTGG